MAVFNAGRLRAIMVRGEIASETAATEFIEEMDSQLDEALSAYPNNDRFALMHEQVLRAIAESEARTARHINQAVGIVVGPLLAGLALAVGIILGFG